MEKSRRSSSIAVDSGGQQLPLQVRLHLLSSSVTRSRDFHRSETPADGGSSRHPITLLFCGPLLFQGSIRPITLICKATPRYFNASSSLLHFLKKPHAFRFLLSVFLLLTWISLRLQSSSSSFSSVSSSSPPWFLNKFSREDDLKANLVRFSAVLVGSRIVRDKRGWMVIPVAVAADSRVSGGAVNCISTHVGEIRPGAMWGNHRHRDCNGTFVIWGARMKFRLENKEMGERDYAEIIIGGDEVAVAARPSGTAHALVNIDPVNTLFSSVARIAL